MAKLLIVEESTILCGMFKRLLDKDGGFDYEVVKTYKEAKEYLNKVGIYEKMNSYPAHLSGGQQQRVAVARAIVANPQVIFADEPTASLDSETGSALIDLFADINRKQNTTFIFSSHDTRIINRANRIINLRDGKMYREL